MVILVVADSISITFMSVLEATIRDMWEIIYWVADRLPVQYIMVKGDAPSILTLFERNNNYTCHSQLCNVRMLGSCFVNFSVQYIWREREDLR